MRRWGAAGPEVVRRLQFALLNKRFTDSYLSLPRLITGEVEEGLAVDEVEQSRKGKLQ